MNERMKFFISCAVAPILFSLPHQIRAAELDQAVRNYLREAAVEKQFVILRSTSNYGEAKSFATRAAQKLNAPLKLRDLAPHEKTGLTFSQDLCEKEWGRFPCYLARGRYDDGVYISIEHTRGYPTFTPGLYIVVLANGDRGDDKVKAALAGARQFYSDAYIRTAPVYLGCMH